MFRIRIEIERFLRSLYAMYVHHSEKLLEYTMVSEAFLARQTANIFPRSGMKKAHETMPGDVQIVEKPILFVFGN